MAGIIKNVVRLGVITTLAGGAVVVVAGPQRCLAVLQQVKQHVNATIDANIDDPIALRSQLRNLEAKYPVRIKEVRRDLYKILSERTQLERELAVDNKAIEITEGKLGQLRLVLARGQEIEQDGSHFVRIRFDHDSRTHRPARSRSTISDILSADPLTDFLYRRKIPPEKLICWTHFSYEDLRSPEATQQSRALGQDNRPTVPNDF